jgi:error-prone DNA polymerase
VFVSLEDETGIANAFVPSTTFETNRLVITQEPFLRIHGRLQKVEGVISVYALRIEALHFERTLGAESHDFH